MYSSQIPTEPWIAPSEKKLSPLVALKYMDGADNCERYRRDDSSIEMGVWAYFPQEFLKSGYGHEGSW